MPECHEMKKGQIWRCEDCGLELEVVAECSECGEGSDCAAEPCEFTCCGGPLTLKE
ncbi:MAG: hypothetical protein JW876_08210 [Candidatus Krumholzibacteriota bacterium]|nr:hypothetical protein [Candidatus Krumholzibacteriota bacterium]